MAAEPNRAEPGGEEPVAEPKGAVARASSGDEAAGERGRAGGDHGRWR